MRTRSRRAVAGFAAAAALLLTLAAYLRPEVAFALATQLWNCF